MFKLCKYTSYLARTGRDPTLSFSEFGSCLMLRQAQHDERLIVTLSLSKCSNTCRFLPYVESIFCFNPSNISDNHINQRHQRAIPLSKWRFFIRRLIQNDRLSYISEHHKNQRHQRAISARITSPPAPPANQNTAESRASKFPIYHAKGIPPDTFAAC